MTWPEFLLWGNAIGSFTAGVVNFSMVRSGRLYPSVKVLRGILAFSYTILYALLIGGVDQQMGVVISRSIALAAWVGVWIVPALLPTHDVKDVVTRVIERVKDERSGMD